MKSLTWVQGGDFSSWWFEDGEGKRVGPKVVERAFYEVENGREVDSFGSIEEARQYIESLIQESMRP